MAYKQKGWSPYTKSNYGKQSPYRDTDRFAGYDETGMLHVKKSTGSRCTVCKYGPGTSGYKPAEANVTESPQHTKRSTPLKRTKPHTSWTQEDRDKYRRENPDSNLKDPQPEGGARKRSYCARSAGIKKCKNPDKNGDCTNDIARRKWKC